MWQFPYYTPGRPLPWEQMDRELDWFREMRGVPQDPVWHGEGDVHTHTRMVVEALTELDEFRALPADRQHMLLAAALLHDVEKRSTTVTELIGGEERITAPGHARKGAQTARGWLYRDCPAPFAVREAIVQLVRLHALPLHAIAKPDPRQAVITASCLTDTALLGLLARADVLGRIAPDREELLLHAALFEELCKEHECYGQPRAFASAYGRWLYLNRDGYAPDYEPYEDRRFEVVILCGLPGAGKDRYLGQLPDLPVVSLDDIRRELKIDPADRRRNGQAVQLGKERARELLRRRQGFIFNATNVTEELRGIWTSLCVEYKARVRLVYIEVPYQQLLRQNADREHPVPASTLDRLILKLEPPTVLEAHTVEYVTEA